MRYRPLGPSSIQASVVGIGTWAIGGTEWGGTDERASIKAIHAALDAGINLVDTAPIYGKGVSENLVGRALEDRRYKAVLATKCGLRWDVEKGEFFYQEPNNGHKVFRYLAEDGLREEVENSLRRLRTDYIDLYQTHWQDATTPIEDTMAALLKLQDEGKIRAIGVSNVSTEQLNRYLESGAVDCDQELFNMLERENAGELFPLCKEKGVAVLAYSPMAMGYLSGKIGVDRQFGEGDVRGFSPRFAVGVREKVAALLERLQPFAEAHDLTMAQLVINWTTVQTGITHVLTGARNPEQAKENARAGDDILTDDEVSEINRIVSEADIELPPLFGD